LNDYLVDVNVLVALGDQDHVHHKSAMRWLDEVKDGSWGTCAFSEAGFMRIMSNPRLRGFTMAQANEVLASLGRHAKYRYWPINQTWAQLAGPFEGRVFGHQQITDACLLGLAIREGGVLVTMDKGILFLAGAKYRQHVLVLE
jgi:toxin-antitoxin system PIN domain toxin